MDPLHLMILFLVVAGVACLMMLFGLSKSTLELKRAVRFCPSCGRRTDDCRCRR